MHFPFQEYVELQTKLTQLRFKEKELLDSRVPSSSEYHSFPNDHPTDGESLPSCTTPTSSSSRTSSTTCDVPGSPVTYAHVRVHLPNKQRTAVSIHQRSGRRFRQLEVVTELVPLVRVKNSGPHEEIHCTGCSPKKVPLQKLSDCQL